jgi:hypothetical protein
MNLTENYSLVAFGSDEDYIFCKRKGGKVTCARLMPEDPGDFEGSYIGAKREYSVTEKGILGDMESGGFDVDEEMEYDDFAEAFWKRIAQDL